MFSSIFADKFVDILTVDPAEHAVTAFVISDDLEGEDVQLVTIKEVKHAKAIVELFINLTPYELLI